MLSPQVIQRNQWGLSPCQAPENPGGGGTSCASWLTGWAVQPGLQCKTHATAALCSGLPCSWGQTLISVLSRVRGVGRMSRWALSSQNSSPWAHLSVDLTKMGSWEGDSMSTFPDLWQQPIFVLFKYKDPANALKVMPWDAIFPGLIWSIGPALLLRLLRALGHVDNHELWCSSSHVLLNHLQDHSGR